MFKGGLVAATERAEVVRVEVCPGRRSRPKMPYYLIERTTAIAMHVDTLVTY